MPALSFQEEWLDALLRGDKKQTTRPQTTRIKVGDVCTLYNQQRRRITDKPIRDLTEEGLHALGNRGYLSIPAFLKKEAHAHLLGKVMITEICDIHPCAMFEKERTAWAIADGFKDSANLGFTEMELADTWFRARYHDDDWMHQTWTVIRWAGWLERYFEAEPGAV